MKRIGLLLLSAVLTAVLCLTVTSCGSPSQSGGEDPDISGICFTGGTFTYDGREKCIEIIGTLPMGVTVEYVNNKRTDAGEQTATARLLSGGALLKELSAQLTVNKAVYDMSGVRFPDAAFTYDATAVSPSVTGTLPDGVTVSYACADEIRQVGTYTVTATFTGDANHEPIPSMTAEYTVNKAVYDMSGVSLPPVSAAYNGQELTPTLQGTLPEGVTCEITSVPPCIKEVGEYRVTATFTGSDQYESIPPLTATYVIRSPEYVDGSLTFAARTDGTYEVVGYIGTQKVIVIPATYKAKAVTTIRSSAFLGNQTVTHVYIPDSVTNIGNKAFKDCENLCTLSLSRSVKVIGAEAFANTALTEIALPDSLQSIGQGAFTDTPLVSMTLPFIGGSRVTSNPFLGYLFGALTHAGNAERVPQTLTSVTVSASAGKIPAYAFYGITSLRSVTVMSGVTSIGNSAFGGCSALCDVYLPATVTAIAADANPFNSPFYGAHGTLVITLGAADADGFGRYWSHISDAATATAVYGTSYDDYLASRE